MSIPPFVGGSGVVTQSRTAIDSSRPGRTRVSRVTPGKGASTETAPPEENFLPLSAPSPQSSVQGQSPLDFVDATAHRDEIPDVQPAIQTQPPRAPPVLPPAPCTTVASTRGAVLFPPQEPQGKTQAPSLPVHGVEQEPLQLLRNQQSGLLPAAEGWIREQLRSHGAQGCSPI